MNYDSKVCCWDKQVARLQISSASDTDINIFLESRDILFDVSQPFSSWFLVTFSGIGWFCFFPTLGKLLVLAFAILEMLYCTRTVVTFFGCSHPVRDIIQSSWAQFASWTLSLDRTPLEYTSAAIISWPQSSSLLALVLPSWIPIQCSRWYPSLNWVVLRLIPKEFPCKLAPSIPLTYLCIQTSDGNTSSLDLLVIWSWCTPFPSKASQ